MSKIIIAFKVFILRIEKEAGESGLIGTNILPYWLKEYKQILKVIIPSPTGLRSINRY